MKTNTSKIEEALIEYLGERCSDFEPECVVCQGWLEFDQLKGNTNTEDTGKWVILNFFPHSPTHVFGFFDTEKEALDYAEKNGMDKCGNAFDIQMVLNAHYQEPRREPWE